MSTNLLRSQYWFRLFLWFSNTVLTINDAIDFIDWFFRFEFLSLVIATKSGWEWVTGYQSNLSVKTLMDPPLKKAVARNINNYFYHQSQPQGSSIREFELSQRPKDIFLQLWFLIGREWKDRTIWNDFIEWPKMQSWTSEYLLS